MAFSLIICCSLRTGKSPRFIGRSSVSSDQLVYSTLQYHRTKGGIVHCQVWFPKGNVRGYTPKIWPDMEKYLHFRILEFPLIMCIVLYIYISKAEAPIANGNSDWLYLIIHTACGCRTHTHISLEQYFCVCYSMLFFYAYIDVTYDTYIYIWRFPKMGVRPNHSC